MTETGLRGVRETALGLSDIPFDAAYCSDLGRAVQTAEILAKYNKPALTPVSMPGLREYHFGKYELEDSAAMWGDVLKALKLDSFSAFLRCEDARRRAFDAIADLDETGRAESSGAFSRRLSKAVNRIVEESERLNASNVLIVSHGAAIATLVEEMGGPHGAPLPNASVTVVEYQSGTYRLLSAGDTRYQEAGASLLRKTEHAGTRSDGAAHV